MEKKPVITVSRQFGSCGREIGRQTAEMLDIGYYDKEIMERIACDMQISPDFFQDDNLNQMGIYQVGYSGFGIGRLTSLSVNADLVKRAASLIQEIAKRESAVFVGRCADFFLQDHPGLITVYICSDLKDRIERVKQEFQLSEKKARRLIQDMDQRRGAFHEFVTGRPFGDLGRFDLVINTSHMSIEEAVHVLCDLFDEQLGYKTLRGGFVGQYDEHRKTYG